MKKIFILILLLTYNLLGLAQAKVGQDSVKTEQKEQAKAEDKKQEENKKDKLSAYERFFKDKRKETSSSKFMTLHKMDGKVFVEMERKQLGTEMLLGLTISSISNPRLGMIGYKTSNPLHSRFVQRDSVIILELVNTMLEFDDDNKRLAQSVRSSYRDLAFLSFPIVTKSADSTKVVFDVSSFFLKDNRFFPTITASGGLKLSHSIQDGLTHINAVKAFDESAVIKLDRSYTATITAGSNSIKNYPVTIGLTFTMLRLPEERMIPRLADSRIGYFQTSKFAAYDGEIQNVDFIKRWRLVPKDPKAYAQGKLTEPIKPIDFYIEPTFPELWKEAIRDGVLRWNEAFERIGFKNAVRALDFPSREENPEFDPDNIKYSCIRYIPIGIENAMGPSWIDPRTGEIINASVLVYSDISKVVNSWRFAQTAQLDERVRQTKMPDDIMRETLAYVLGHEVGHTLGLMHNMGASWAFPTDSLRSADFTQRYGTTPSIMDYARFNYIAQASDKGVKLTPPKLGVYDYYAIEWGYKYFPELKGDFRRESKEISKLIQQHERNPLYRYGTQQFGAARFDPTAVEEDLGNDPIKGAEYGLQNIRYILSNINTWIRGDEDSKHKRELYQEIAGQAYRYVSFVFSSVPGIRLYQTSEESKLPRYEVLPKERQRASALWLLKAADEIESLANTELEDKLPGAAGRPFRFIANDIRAMSILNAGRLGLSEYLDPNSYTQLEYLEDVYQYIWAKALRGEENLSAGERKHQALFAAYVSSVIEPVKQIQTVNAIGAQMPSHEYNPEKRWASLRQEIRLASGENEETSHTSSEHLCSLQSSCSEHTNNSSQVSALNFGSRYGQPDDIWDRAINRTKDYVFLYLKKTRSLLEDLATKTQDKELRAHYRYLLHKLKSSMDK